MSHKTMPRKTGRYPFAHRNRSSPTEQRSLEMPEVQHSMLRTLGRFAHWDRQKHQKHH
jgi:hypothetical protein